MTRYEREEDDPINDRIHVIPAEPGWYAVQPFTEVDEGERQADLIPVIAWAVHAHYCPAVTVRDTAGATHTKWAYWSHMSHPVLAGGISDSDDSNPVLRMPSGQVLDMGEIMYDSVDEYCAQYRQLKAVITSQFDDKD